MEKAPDPESCASAQKEDVCPPTTPKDERNIESPQLDLLSNIDHLKEVTDPDQRPKVDPHPTPALSEPKLESRQSEGSGQRPPIDSHPEAKLLESRPTGDSAFCLSSSSQQATQQATQQDLDPNLAEESEENPQHLIQDERVRGEMLANSAGALKSSNDNVESLRKDSSLEQAFLGCRGPDKENWEPPPESPQFIQDHNGHGY
ncbi:uncharacterized protein [Amphiura filiformis]|uniref:uncharacterized protein n=1 Tax=Amphiura filiformis TaxID=82378 RepID=UPI003B226C89